MQTVGVIARSEASGLYRRNHTAFIDRSNGRMRLVAFPIEENNRIVD